MCHDDGGCVSSFAVRTVFGCRYQLGLEYLLNSNESVTPLKKNKLAMRVAKWVIAVTVLAGLFVAGRSAILQWRQEHAKVQRQIDEIDVQLNAADDATKRDLESRREKLLVSMPSWSSIRWEYCFLASVLYSLGLVPSGLLLRRALVSLGQKASVGTSIAAQLLGHLGKYVPGKAMVVVIRAGVLSRDGVKVMPATVSIFLETFLMMAVGGVVAGAVVVWLPVPRWIAAMSVGISLVACLPTFPMVLRVIVKRIVKDFSSSDGERLGWGLFLSGWAWSLLSWILIGASFTLLVAAIPGFAVSGSEKTLGTLELYLVCTAAISLAVVIGFASLLPGGAGVRELVVTTVLSVVIGPSHAILAAIAARIMFAVCEAFVALCCWIWLRGSLRIKVQGGDRQ